MAPLSVTSVPKCLPSRHQVQYKTYLYPKEAAAAAFLEVYKPRLLPPNFFFMAIPTAALQLLLSLQRTRLGFLV